MEFHPLAELFPLMEGAEFDELVADVKKNALRYKITLYEGKILDGRNRYRAMLAAGDTPTKAHFLEYKPILPSDTPLSYVITANLHRRHLTTEQKREIIAKLLKAQPEKSDRQIGKQIGAHHTTVGTVRKAEEARGEISHVETHTDTKGRAQPARKARSWSRERYAAHRARKRGHPVKEVAEPEPVEQPENNDLEILSNPITRAWCKATNKQRREFALEYKELIAGFVEEEQRRHPHAEPRRFQRPANDLNTKIETKIGAEENATNGGGADFGPLSDSATAAFAQPPFNQQPQPITPPAGPAQPIAELEPLTSARPWPMVDDAGPIPSFLVRDEAPAGAAAR
jgi:hypothetical protein